MRPLQRLRGFEGVFINFSGLLRSGSNQHLLQRVNDLELSANEPFRRDDVEAFRRRGVLAVVRRFSTIWQICAFV